MLAYQIEMTVFLVVKVLLVIAHQSKYGHVIWAKLILKEGRRISIKGDWAWWRRT